MMIGSCLLYTLHHFSNKTVLTGFPFPYTLTAVHALFSTLGGTWLRWRGAYTSKHLGGRHELVLAGFSFLYAINIAVSNVSLNLVTVPVSPCPSNMLTFVHINTVSSSSTRRHARFHNHTIHDLLQYRVQQTEISVSCACHTRRRSSVSA